MSTSDAPAEQGSDQVAYALTPTYAVLVMRLNPRMTIAARDAVCVDADLHDQEPWLDVLSRAQETYIKHSGLLHEKTKHMHENKDTRSVHVA